MSSHLSSQFIKPRNWPYAALLGVLVLFNFLPHRLKVGICSKLGLLVHRLAHSRREVARVNVGLCFPEMSPEEIKKFVKCTFQNWTIAFVEIGMGWFGMPKGFLDNLEVIGAEHLQAAIAQDKGVILLAGHFSTMDLSTAIFRQRFPDLPVHIVYRDQKNPLINHYMNGGRLKYANSVIPKTNMRKVLRCLRNREIVWYAPDHDFGKANSVFVPFFSQTAATLTTTSKLAQMTGSPVVMMSQYRSSPDQAYSLRFWPALENFPSDDEEADARAVNQAIEQAVLGAPTQYMWIHKRFKTQPDMPNGSLYKNIPAR